MDTLGDLLMTSPMQTGWEISIEPYPNWQFVFVDNPDRPFGNGSVQTQTQTQSDGPEPSLTLHAVHSQLPLPSFSSPHIPIQFLAVHWFSTTDKVLHLKQGNLSFPGKIAIFYFDSLHSPAPNSLDIRMSGYITICISLPILTQLIVNMASPASFCSTLVPPIFLVNLLQIFPLNQCSPLVQGPLLIPAALRGHLELRSVFHESDSPRNWTVIFKESSM